VGAVNKTILKLADLGLHLFTVDHPILPLCVGRHALGQSCDGTRGKHPEPLSWARESTTNPAMLNRMFGRGPRNVGIDCGRSALVVLDEDAPGELDRLCRDRGRQLPKTLTVSTGKGRHVYLHQPDGLPFTNSPGALKCYRIDIRGRGGYVVGPGSLHASGCLYSVTTVAPIAPVPGWVAELLRPPAPPAVAQPIINPAVAGSRQALTGLLRVILDAPVGQRNTSLNWAAWRMWQKVRAGQVSESAAAGMLLDAAAAVGLGEGEARATIGSARRAVLGA
jgi:bifunctional DNA primase/polymerase-like protein